MVRGAAAASRSAESAPGAVLGLATGAIGGAVAAAAGASAKTVTESVGAFRDGADTRIKGMREPNETPVNSGESTITDHPEDKA